jgi:4-diphosphocytidyl-2-C-methyl-D-erythritol kinase
LILPQSAQLATADVYREADRLGLPRLAADLGARRRELLSGLGSGSELPRRLVVNDLEPAAVSLCPQIEAALAHARRSGADQAIVCGSGPTVAGLYWGTGALARATAGAQALGVRFAGAIAVAPVDDATTAPQPA